VGSLPTVQADATQMRQLFQNLIGNALKFHKEDEKPIVKVFSQSANEQLKILVADNGIGFPFPSASWKIQQLRRNRYGPCHLQKDYRAPRRDDCSEEHTWERLDFIIDLPGASVFRQSGDDGPAGLSARA
jgi:hypothetical protein